MQFLLDAIGLGKYWQAWQDNAALVAGAGAVFIGVGQLVLKAADAKQPGDLFALLQGLPTSPEAAQITAGLGIIKLHYLHHQNKAAIANASVSSPAAAAVAPASSSSGSGGSAPNAP